MGGVVAYANENMFYVTLILISLVHQLQCRELRFHYGKLFHYHRCIIVYFIRFKADVKIGAMSCGDGGAQD